MLLLKLSEESLTTLNRIGYTPLGYCFDDNQIPSLLTTGLTSHTGKQISISDIDLQENKNHYKKHPDSVLLKPFVEKWENSPHFNLTKDWLHYAAAKIKYPQLLLIPHTLNIKVTLVSVYSHIKLEMNLQPVPEICLERKTPILWRLEWKSIRFN